MSWLKGGSEAMMSEGPWGRLVVVAAVLMLTAGALVTPALGDDGSDDGAEASQPAAGEEPAPLENSLKWTTASEVDNFGFHIYRATSEDGPFERMTTDPIPGAGTIDEPQHYLWVDDTIEPDQAYWYYIESISIDNVRERFSPVIKAPAKHPGPAASDGEQAEGEAEAGDAR